MNKKLIIILIGIIAILSLSIGIYYMTSSDEPLKENTTIMKENTTINNDSENKSNDNPISNGNSNAASPNKRNTSSNRGNGSPEDPNSTQAGHPEYGAPGDEICK